MDEPNIQALWGRLLVDRLVAMGVERWVIAPGSRASPLVRAAALNDKADVRIRVDERGAAFHALGLARGSGKPAAVITTSGTAVANLLPLVDKVVVVGGRNSNNTRQLVSACEAGGGDVVQVQGPEDLDPRWFEGCATVGLTAGTSTLDQVVDTVARVLEGMGQDAAPDELPVGPVVSTRE